MKKKKKKINFLKFLAIGLVVISLIFIGLIYFMDLLPLKYFVVLFLGIVVLNLTGILCLIKPHKTKNLIGIFLSLFLMILMIFAINYQVNTLSFLQKIGFQKYSIEYYGVYVLKSSEYTKIKDLNNKSILYLQEKSEEMDLAFEKIESKITVNFIKSDIDEINLNNFENGILINDAHAEIIKEENEYFFNSLKKIYSFQIKKKLNVENKSVDINKESYNLYITGIDTYGSVNSSSRSDVNMIVSVNPKTNKVLLTSIPRDYYVLLPKYNSYDKLTHSGIYGIDTSIKTLENLLNIDINYFVKVNFSSLTTIVDALKGINIYSKYDFTTKDGYHFKKGLQKINGKEALSFSRERKAFAGGDRVRIENQQIVLMGILNKLISPSIIVNYNSFLKSLNDKFITNIEHELLIKAIKKQINENKKWNFDNISLNGKDGSEYTYSYKNQKLYVMVPDKNSVKYAEQKIKSILVG